MNSDDESGLELWWRCPIRDRSLAYNSSTIMYRVLMKVIKGAISFPPDTWSPRPSAAILLYSVFVLTSSSQPKEQRNFSWNYLPISLLLFRLVCGRPKFYQSPTWPHQAFLVGSIPPGFKYWKMSKIARVRPSQLSSWRKLKPVLVVHLFLFGCKWLWRRMSSQCTPKATFPSKKVQNGCK